VSAEEEDRDDWTPYERGLQIGNATAKSIARGELQAAPDEDTVMTPGEFLRALAADTPHVPVQLRDLIMDSGMTERLAESEDPDAESAFWGGFRQGVRAHIVEMEIGGDN
jgi:hypothetical protein